MLCHDANRLQIAFAERSSSSISELIAWIVLLEMEYNEKCAADSKDQQSIYLSIICSIIRPTLQDCSLLYLFIFLGFRVLRNTGIWW